MRLEKLKEILSDCFVLMADRTRYAIADETATWYCRKFLDERVAPAAIVTAIDEIMEDWDGGRWPSPNVIITRARQLMYDAEDLMAGERQRSSELENAYQVEDVKRWERRKDIARGFLHRHKGIFPAIEKEVLKEAEKAIASFNLSDSMLAKMRDGFCEGAVIGMCIELERLEHTKAGARRIQDLIESVSNPEEGAEVAA